MFCHASACALEDTKAASIQSKFGWSHPVKHKRRAASRKGPSDRVRASDLKRLQILMVRILELGEDAQKRDHDLVGLLVVNACARKRRHQYGRGLVESGDRIDSCIQFGHEISIVPQCDA